MSDTPEVALPYGDHSECNDTPECTCRLCAAVRAHGINLAKTQIAEFAEREATRLERRGDNYGTLAAVALDNFAHAIRDGRRIDPEGELR